MTTKERELFAIAIAGIAETLGHEITPARISGLLVALDDVPWRYLEPALRAYHKTARFVPSPGELRELAAEAAARPVERRPALAEQGRDSIIASWAGKDDEVQKMLAALPESPPWPAERPDFSGWAASVARRMQAMCAGGSDARTDPDPKG